MMFLRTTALTLFIIGMMRIPLIAVTEPVPVQIIDPEALGLQEEPAPELDQEMAPVDDAPEHDGEMLESPASDLDAPSDPPVAPTTIPAAPETSK